VSCNKLFKHLTCCVLLEPDAEYKSAHSDAEFKTGKPVETVLTRELHIVDSLSANTLIDTNIHSSSMTIRRLHKKFGRLSNAENKLSSLTKDHIFSAFQTLLVSSHFVSLQGLPSHTSPDRPIPYQLHVLMS
jgi:hypothetical protein